MRKTSNIGLPLYEAGETPAHMGDWNSTMVTIDENIGSGGGSTETVIFAGRLTGTSQTDNRFRLALPDALSSLGSTWRSILTALFQTYDKITIHEFCHFSPNPDEQQMCQPEITIYKSAFNAVAYPYTHVYNDVRMCLTFASLGNHEKQPNYFRLAIDTTTDYIEACRMQYDSSNDRMRILSTGETDLNYVIITAE